MPPQANADFEGLLRTLTERGVQFVVIGGVSAALQGVPALTHDLDIVLEPSAENLDLTFELLGEFDACFRKHLPAKRIGPLRADLESPGAMLLMTRLGPLGILGRRITGWRFADLEDRTRTLHLAPELQLRVLDLAHLIEVKEAIGRDKDLAVLPLYRRALSERDSTNS